MKRTSKLSPIAAGLAEIDQWHRWFLDAHAQRLAALELSADQHARELAAVTELGDAVAAHQRVEFFLRQSP
jgi:hypothetical protein